MDAFEEFMQWVLTKVSLSPIEDHCKAVFTNTLLNVIKQGDTFQGSINLGLVLEATYKILSKDKTRVVALVFSDQSVLYANRYTLMHIEFFNNYFTDNGGEDDVVIKMQLTGVIDDYEIMEDIINFCLNGSLCINVYDYEKLYKLATVNQYLLGVYYEKQAVSRFYCRDACELKYSSLIFPNLREFIRVAIKEMMGNCKDKCPLDFEYKEGCFDMIAETQKMVHDGIGYIIYAKKTGIFYKYKEEMEKSQLNDRIITDF